MAAALQGQQGSVPSEIQLIVYSGLQITSPHSSALVFVVMQCGTEKFKYATRKMKSVFHDRHGDLI
jgi:hypothetical protein